MLIKSPGISPKAIGLILTIASTLLACDRVEEVHVSKVTGKEINVVIEGTAQKGPFLLGSKVSIGPLLPNGFYKPEFGAETIDDMGNFEIYSETLGPHVITVQGFHYNEIGNTISLAELKLNAVYDITEQKMQKAYVNLLTHLSSVRAIYLVKNEGIQTGPAIKQAEADVINAFQDVLPVSTLSDFTQLNLYNTDPKYASGNAYVVALSAILYQYATLITEEFPEFGVDAILSQRLNLIARDIADDGLINDDSMLLPKLKLAARTLKPNLVVSNLENYSFFTTGAVMPVANLNLYIDTDGDGTANHFDEDDDNDGILDKDDLDPYNPSDTGTITYVPIENGNYQIEMDENGYDAVMGNEFDMTLVLRKLGPNSALRTIDGKSGYNIIQGTASEDWLDFRNTELLNVHQIQGLDRNDVIFGSRGNDTIVGGKGHDTLNGYDGDDTFLIEGNNQGSDSISGGNGFDQILGSADDDTISLSIFSGERRVERIDGGLGHNIIQGSLNSSYLNFSETELINIARIEGRDGRDSIIGSQGNDIINGGKNHDILKGHDGDDTFLVYGKDQGFDTFNGGSGYDQILGSDEDDIIGLTVFSAENRVEKIDGGLGLNIIQGSRNSSFLNFSETELINIARIEGMDGRDAITGSRGDDIIVGGKDHDLLDGHDGNDTFLVHGSDQGFDNVSGGEGFDQILGSEGDDVFGFSQFTGERRVEKIDGGLGYNFIHCSNGRSGFNFSETKLVNIARIEGMDGNNVIVGSPGNDTMIGHEGNDQLDGHDGIDIAVFQGNRTDFNITVNEGVVIIQDLNLNDGDEGSDTLRNFEFIQFSDQTIDLNTLN